MGTWNRSTLRSALAGIAALVVLALAAPARGVELPAGAEGKIAPRLLAALAGATSTPASVWVTFADKGEQGPGDLARRLAETEAALDPHARARRLRAGVTPLVDYLDLPVHAPYVEALRARGLAPYGVSRWFNRVAVRADGAQALALAGLPFVARLDPVETAVRTPDLPGTGTAVRTATPSGASRAELAYGLTARQVTQIGVPALHDSGFTGAGVRICMLDEGYNYFNVHPALAGASVIALRDFVDGDWDPTDTLSASGYSHGTWTMSCIGGNVPGVYVGTAPGATFALGRTENSFSEHRVEMVYWGMGAEWADSLGADIISSSLGYDTFDSPDTSYTYAAMDGHTTIITRAAEIAARKGILVVNSAGNEGCSSPSFCWYYVAAPADANGDSMIAVGAVDSTGALASFSSHGPTYDGRIKPDLVARGRLDWVAADADQGYLRLSGTSFSCPLVAGLAACLMQAQPSWPPVLIVRALRTTASRANNPDNNFGYGLPNGAAALQWIRDTASVPWPPASFAGLRLAGPNPLTPAAPRTRVEFGVGTAVGRPRLRVFDAQGRLVVRDLGYARNAGGAGGLPQAAAWDGRSDDGRLLPAGLYFITLEAGGRRSSVRVISLR